MRDLPPVDERPLAAIDVGTNSVHLVIARATPLGPIDVLAREKEKVRLGSGERDMKSLDPEAVERTVAAIDRFAQIATAYDAELVAVATSAVRESDDPRAFLDKVRQATGVRIEVIAGVEEARLIQLGALSAVAAGTGNHLVIDIGGGSTEVVVGRETEPLLLRSMKMGHIRLTDGFMPGGVIEPGSVKRLKSFVKSFLSPVAIEVRELGHDLAIGCSGTIETVAAIAARLDGRAVRTVDNLVLTRAAVDAAVEALVARPRPEDRIGLPGLDDARADVIVAGSLLLQQLFRAFRIKEMVVSPHALREGVVLDRINRRDGVRGALHHLSDLRRRSVLAVAHRYDEDVAHAEHATDLALALFDQTASIHELGEPERQILEAAGVLHNVGRFIAHAAHHKHSYYLIRHSEQLLGFTEQELELIALVARYHRKSMPRGRHAEYSALSEPDQQRVRVLAGLLRVGIGLDRTYQRVVQEVDVDIAEASVEIALQVAPDAGADLEVFAAEERAGLLALALEREIGFRVVGTAQDRGGRSTNAGVESV
jgi:exopolyphosphatase/guanosine-5'-triphosphate,3'-diphosphate pyrophosphatase